MTAEFVGFFVLTITNIAAACIIFVGALREKMRLYPAWHKLGLLVAALGLASQAFRNVQFLYTGISPSDSDMPLWVLKDAGISLVAFGYLYLAATGQYDAAINKIHSKPVVKNAKRRK